MAKKYMTANGMELLKRFGISGVDALINSRCSRLYCACGKILEDESKCSCGGTGPSITVSLGAGDSTIYRKVDELFCGDLPGVEKKPEDTRVHIYFNSLVANVNVASASEYFRTIADFLYLWCGGSDPCGKRVEFSGVRGAAAHGQLGRFAPAGV